MLRVVSYNIYFGKKTEDILTWLSTEDIDIICLQEFPEKHLLLLKEAFPNHNYEFVTSFRWDKAYGQVTLYKKNILQPIATKKFGVSTSFKKKVLKYGENRHALLTRFTYQHKTFTLINAHLTPLAMNSRRIQELERILEEVTNEPVILLGDLNYSSLLPRKKLFAFMQKHKMSHATKGLMTHTLLGIPQQMDYIFHREVKLRQARIKRQRFSDHQPIFAEAEFN